jgi:hypothetical protein
VVPVPQTIAVLGAPGTGPGELAAALNRQAAWASGALHAVALDAGTDIPHSLPDAVSILRGATLTLLMGLDLPCTAVEQGLREAFDRRLRTVLSEASVRYHVVYGNGPQRLQNALLAIGSIANEEHPQSASGNFSPEHATLRAWYCEKCGDPECEHRLFSALVGR